MPKLFNVTAANRRDWLIDHRRRLSASDVAVVLGLSPYADRTPLSLWMDKTSGEPLEDHRPTPHQRWGLLVEDDMLELYADDTGARVLDYQAYHEDAHNSLFTATLDAVVERDGELRVLELKSVHPGSKVAKLLGPEDTDELPEFILLQVQQQLAVADLQVADVAVLVGGPPIRHYTVRREQGLIAAYTPRLERWWEQHILGHTAPGITTSEDIRAVLDLHRSRQGEKLIHDQAVLRKIDRYLWLQAVRGEIDHEAKRLKADLAVALGDCTRAQSEDGAYVLTCRETTRKGYTVEPTSYQDFRVRGPKPAAPTVNVVVPTPEATDRKASA